MQRVMIKNYDITYQQQVIDLILGIQNGEFNIDINIDDQPDLLCIPDIYQINLGNFWVALDGEQVIGTIGLLPLDQHTAAIRKMFVHSAYRGSGVAQQLIDGLIGHAQNVGITNLYLGTVSRLNAAIRFYEKCGFTRIDKVQLPAIFTPMRVDNVFFVAKLPQC